MCAMIRLYKSKRFADIGWKMIMQIHDELILEGPAETADEALKITVTEMQKSPPNTPLLVDLDVSASICDNWMEGK